MDDTLITIQHLLREVAEHLKSRGKSDRTAAAAKLHSIAVLSATLAFTVAVK